MKQALGLTLVASLWALNGAGSAFALGPDSSWSEIRSTPGILIRAPMILFGAHAISVLDICRNGDSLRAQSSEGTKVEVPVRSASQSYNIEVHAIVGGIRRTREILLFIKRFDIPTCGDPAERPPTSRAEAPVQAAAYSGVRYRRGAKLLILGNRSSNSSIRGHRHGRIDRSDWIAVHQSGTSFDESA